MNYLSPKQRIAIANLTSPVSDEKYKFYTKEDANNFVNRNILCTEDVKHCTCIADLFYAFDKEDVICIDIETTGLNPCKDKIKILGMSNGTNHLYCTDEELIRKCIVELQNWKYIIAYNIQFEHQFIWHSYNIDFVFYGDPMLMGYVLYNAPCKLSTLASSLLRRYPKSLEEIAERKFTSAKPFDWEQDVVEEEVCAYCCEDCYETVLLHYRLQNKMTSREYSTYSLDLKATRVASLMSAKGIAIDLNKLPKLQLQIEEYIAELQAQITEQVGWYANPKSPKQMNQLLFEQLNLDTSELKLSAQGYSVDAKARQLLAPQHDVVQKYDYIAKLQDALNKYVTKMQDWVQYDGRVHTQFNTALTSTGRLSSSHPNLQNIPNPDKYISSGNKFIGEVGMAIRNLFCASSPDHVLIACDYSSFELRILAHLSQDPELIKVFREGGSLHDAMTCKLFGIDYDSTNPDHKAKRTVVKTINFGLCYGLTYVRLYEECKLRGMNWSKEDCKRIISSYWQELSTLAKWFEQIKRNAIQDGYTTSMFGRKRYYQFSDDAKYANVNFPNDFAKLQKQITSQDAEFLRQAGNHVIQGTNADAIRLAMHKCNDISNATLLLQIHDELVFECKAEHSEQVAKDIKHCMESCITLDVPVIAEPKTATRWGETK